MFDPDRFASKCLLDAAKGMSARLTAATLSTERSGGGLKAEGIGLKFGDPPTVVVTYTSCGKLRARRIRLRGTADMTAESLTGIIFGALPPELDKRSLSWAQVQRVAEKILRQSAHIRPPKLVQAPVNEFAPQAADSNAVDSLYDYNKVRTLRHGTMSRGSVIMTRSKHCFVLATPRSSKDRMVACQLLDDCSRVPQGVVQFHIWLF